MFRLRLVAACLLVLASVTGAQEFRGSISGVVADSSGAAVPGAQVIITNAATNTPTTATTNEEGSYTALYLTPGQYTVSVEASGFKRLVRQSVEVNVGDKLELNLALEIGDVTETVSVTADSTPLLDTQTATAGQVIDRRRIAELPLADGNPFNLTRLAPGISFTGVANDLGRGQKPTDNGSTSAFVTDGAPGGNEFTLDGSPNTGAGRNVAFIPPADAVQEFKVVTASFDAQQGHTAGASVDVTLKSGTNGFHGTIYEFVRNDILNANDFFLNRVGTDRQAFRYNRWGATVGGPVLLPRFGEGGPGYVSGRNRTFFFFAYEGFRDFTPEPSQYTVPTVAQRNGDLSALLPQGIQIYDPQTARCADGQTVIVGGQPSCRPGVRVVREAFPGNIIPGNRINSIARNYLNFYPLPNQPGDAQGRNNYISVNPNQNDYHSESVRVDHTINDKQKLFVRYTHNGRGQSRNTFTGEVGGIRPSGFLLARTNDGANYDHVYTASPTTVLNFRAGYSRFIQTNRPPSEGLFDAASLGFSSSTAALLEGLSVLPQFQIGPQPTGTRTFSDLGGAFGNAQANEVYSVQPTLTKIIGNHNVRAGYDFRAYRENRLPGGQLAGRYDFSTNFTRLNDQASTAAPIGQELAAFLLGQPTGGTIERNTARSNQVLYQGLFMQDDWKATRKLTFNLGLRYEYEGATTERFNRNIRSFDPTLASPVEAAARASYAASPIPQLAPNAFNVRGGLTFVDANNRGFFEPDKNNFQPRVGFAYGLNERTVIRGGVALYTVPLLFEAIDQSGFSQATPILASPNNGLSFNANLFDPFPGGVADPPGASLGAGTFLGRVIDFYPNQRKNGQSQRYELSLQRELPGQFVVEVSYVGNRAYDLTTTSDILNAVPSQYLSTSPVRDQANVNFLTELVPNPFRGLELFRNTALFQPTVAREQLLRPFPQFGAITNRRQDGSSTYHGGQLTLEKRFTQGYTLLVSYTFSKLLEKLSFLNDTDTEYEKRISPNDVPHRLALSGIYELPFGKNRRFGSNWSGVKEAVLGGLQVQGIYQYQTGRPLALGNLAFFGDGRQLRTNIQGATVDATFDTSGFYFSDAAVQRNGIVDLVLQRNDARIRLERNIRTLPTRLSNFRGQKISLVDLSVIKNIAFTETVKLQLRGEFLNAFNFALFTDPILTPNNSSFGSVTQQGNLPRNAQLGIKLIF